MRLLVEVNISRHVVERPRFEGLDVVRASEIMDPRAPDEEIITEARRLGAVLISHDQDFHGPGSRVGKKKPARL